MTPPTPRSSANGAPQTNYIGRVRPPVPAEPPLAPWLPRTDAAPETDLIPEQQPLPHATEPIAAQPGPRHAAQRPARRVNVARERRTTIAWTVVLVIGLLVLAAYLLLR